jgi:hypothetical protein
MLCFSDKSETPLSCSINPNLGGTMPEPIPLYYFVLKIPYYHHYRLQLIDGAAITFLACLIYVPAISGLISVLLSVKHIF